MVASPPSRSSVSVAVAAAASASLIATALALASSRRRRRILPRADAAPDDESSSSSSSASCCYPPTPPDRHWLFGHALALRPPAAAGSGQRRAHHDLVFLEWTRRLSSKVVMFELPLLGRFIAIADADVARHVLTSKAGSFPKSPTYRALSPLIGRRSMVATEGGDWSSQRRLYNPGFSPDFLRGVVSVIVEKAGRFVSRCDDDVRQGAPTDMLGRAIDLTSDVIAAVAFGEDWGVHKQSQSNDNDGIGTLETIRELTSVVGENMSNPISRINPANIWRTWRLSRSLDRDIRRLVRRRIELIHADSRGVDSSMKRKDILSLTLSSVLDAKENSLSNKGTGVVDVSFSGDDMENTTSQLKTFYFAGHDTTATTIAWAYWLLVQHPESLDKAREEVSSSLGKSWADDAASVGEGGLVLRPTTYEALQQCEYLDAVARETLRLYPPAATTRYSVDPSAHAGAYRLGGSIVHLNFYAIQRDPDVWGEDADMFVPERFMGEAGRKRVASFSFLPFSKGSRDCIGKYFALLETKIALAALICRYEGTVVDPNEVYGSRVTSIPVGGCKVMLQRRNML